MPAKMKFVTIPLHISAAVYALLGLICPLIFALVLVFGRGVGAAEVLLLLIFGGLAVVMAMALAVFIEIVVAALKQGKYWSWIAAICLAGLYIPSGFCILGIFMLIGLLDAEVSAFCARIKPGQSQA